MKLPILETRKSVKENTESFSGYCRKIKNSPSEWFNQKNMTTDYYPAASPREKRSLQFNNLQNSITETDLNPVSGEASQTVYTAYETLNANYIGDDLYVLKKVKNGQNEDVGCCFIKNGENIVSSAEVIPKLSYFTANTAKRSLARIGSDIGVFPDGLIYESSNTDTEIPLFKISAEETLNDFFLVTVYKRESDREYKEILTNQMPIGVDTADGRPYWFNNSDSYRDLKTYIKISVPSSTGHFKNFRINDTFQISTTGPSGLTESLFSDIVFKPSEEYSASSYYSIVDMGSEIKNSVECDYIIIDGFFTYKYSKGNNSDGYWLYLNSSSFASESKYVQGNAQMKFFRKCPDIALACESQNRIWGCSSDGHEIYASALGNPYSFYNFSGLSTDSYAVNVGTQGEFTGCVNYLGRPLFFKENALHIISGSYPTNGGALDGMSYSVTTVTEFKGVEKGSEKSLAIIDNILYYKSSSGIVAYDGANTVVISDKLGNVRYKNAVAGAYKNKYYVSMQDSSGNYNFFVYDTELGTWCREDNVAVLHFFNVDNELLFIDAQTQKIHGVSDENVLMTQDYAKEGDFEWECETGNLGYSYPNNKYLSRFQFRIQLSEGAKASFYIQYNSDGVWHRKGEMTGKGIHTYLFPIIPVRCDHMKIKISGKGDMKLFSISKILEEGGDV